MIWIGSLQHGILVGADLVGVAVAFAGAVLTVAQEMGRDELVDDRGSWLPGPRRSPASSSPASCSRTTWSSGRSAIERANDVVAVSVGQWPIGLSALK